MKTLKCSRLHLTILLLPCLAYPSTASDATPATVAITRASSTPLPAAAIQTSHMSEAWFTPQVYTIYHINEAGTSSCDVTFAKPGEIWLSSVYAFPKHQWLSSGSVTAKANQSRSLAHPSIWVFYNVIEGGNPLTEPWHMYCTETSIKQIGGKKC